jgi:hypothetical protein
MIKLERDEGVEDNRENADFSSPKTAQRIITFDFTLYHFNPINPTFQSSPAISISNPHSHPPKFSLD